MRLLTSTLKLPFTKKLLNCFLLLVFLYQVYNSVCKLQQGQLGIKIVHESRSEHSLPAFSFCQAEFPAESDQSFVEQYEALKDKRIVERVIVATTQEIQDFVASMDR